MAPLRALVTIKLLSLEDIPGAVRLGRTPPYAMAQIAGRRFGRSAPIVGERLDLTAEAVKWVVEIRADGSDIPIELGLWHDRGDLSPTRVAHTRDTIASPYTSGKIELGKWPRVVAEVDTLELPDDGAADVYVPRVADGLKHGAVIVIPTVVVVTIAQVRGLERPVAPGKDGIKRSEAVAGYVSEDDLGRAYLDRDLDGKWKKATQMMELRATVDVRSGTLPQDARVKWTQIGVDDPTNDDPGFHSEWGPYVDPKDYDKRGAHKGAQLGDNEGDPAHDPPWAEVTGFPLQKRVTASAETKIVGGESKVLLHCPSLAGDNFMVRAEIKTASSIHQFPHQTGIITMWHRVDVQVLQMPSALPLPVDGVPAPFEPACVQLDIHPPDPITDEQFLAPNPGGLTAASARFVDRVFTKKSEPGWFCVIAAMEPHPTPDRDGKELFKGKVKLKSEPSGWEFVEIPGTRSDADFIYLGPATGGKQIGFHLDAINMELMPDGNMVTRCWVIPHDAVPEFTAGDGSVKHAYASRRAYGPRFQGKWNATTTPGGYGIPEEPDAVLYGAGESYAGGISPSVGKGGEVLDDGDDKKPEFFAGRTIVFTHHQVYFNRKTKLETAKYRPIVTEVLVHELVHAFGMPHKCAYFDWRTPREATCVMNYGWNWMVDAKRNLIPGSDAKTGMQLCGRHLKEVRRTRLHLNKGLAWK